jgi:DNA-binding response OmpR family regulator
MLRRHAEPDEEHPGPRRWRFGDVEVDCDTHDVRRGVERVTLRPKEFDLLVALLQREGRVATRAELLDEVWQYEHDVVSRTVDVHILELRRKLEADPATPQHIITVRKTGYRLAR